MPTKLGNGGNGPEAYDPQNGRYVDEGNISREEADMNGLSEYERQKIASRLLGVDIVQTDDINDVIPPIKSDGEERIFLKKMSKKQQQKFLEEAYGELFELAKQIENDFSYEVDTPSSIDDQTEDRINAREMWIRSEIKKQQTEKNIKRERKFYLVLGIPASGKSTIQNQLIQNTGSFEIDADIFKEYTPEYINDTRNVSYVHAESVYLANKMMKEVADQGDNIVLSKVGGMGSYSLLSKMIKELKKNGYEINLVLNDLPVDLAIKRSISRYQETGRLIPPIVYKNSDGYIYDTFNRLMNGGLVEGCSVFSNDVKLGEKPKLLYKNNKWNGDLIK